MSPGVVETALDFCVNPEFSPSRWTTPEFPRMRAYLANVLLVNRKSFAPYRNLALLCHILYACKRGLILPVFFSKYTALLSLIVIAHKIAFYVQIVVYGF